MNVEVSKYSLSWKSTGEHRRLEAFYRRRARMGGRLISKIKMSADTETTTEIPEEIFRKVGRCVLLPIPRGEKGPKFTGWQKLTLDDMTPEHLARLNHGSNIGVLLGRASSGLCTVDVDDNEQLERFLSVNQRLRQSLISRGARGGNIWIRIKGAYPPSGKIKTANGEPFGEFRADGSQTVIYGTHPSGIGYRNNGRKVIEIQFDEIIWPDGLSLPWGKRKKPRDPLEGIIVLPSGGLQLYESAKRAYEILAKSETLFLRGGRVSELLEGEDGSRLAFVTEQAFRSRIEKHAKVMAYRAGPRREEFLTNNARCSLDTSRVWLDSDAKKLLPPIVAIHNCPLLLEDNGHIQILGKGYHQKSGGLLVAGGEMPQEMELPEAADALLGIVDEFDFATEADKSRAIASLLTPALKFSGLLGAHTPLFVVEADDSQAGKGFLLELVQTIYCETPFIVTQRQGGVGGFDESLSQAMIDARPFIQLDNVRGRIGSPYFEAVLTCPLKGTIPARVPYKGEVQVMPARFVFQLTSNGFESTRDLANRSCIARIRKRRGFSFRRYPEGNLLEHVAANQPRYLGAIYCVISQWLAHGKRPLTTYGVKDVFGAGRKSWTGLFKNSLISQPLWMVTKPHRSGLQIRP